MSQSPSDLLTGSNSAVIPIATPATPIETPLENPTCNCSVPSKKVCFTHLFNWILLAVAFIVGIFYFYHSRSILKK